jgi:hypothetical protein
MTGMDTKKLKSPLFLAVEQVQAAVFLLKI